MWVLGRRLLVRVSGGPGVFRTERRTWVVRDLSTAQGHVLDDRTGNRGHRPMTPGSYGYRRAAKSRSLLLLADGFSCPMCMRSFRRPWMTNGGLLVGGRRRRGALIRRHVFEKLSGTAIKIRLATAPAQR